MFSSVDAPFKKSLTCVHFKEVDKSYRIESVIGKPNYKYSLKVNDKSEVLDVLTDFDKLSTDLLKDGFKIDQMISVQSVKRKLNELIHLIDDEEE